jgi:hypothetical protein
MNKRGPETYISYIWFDDFKHLSGGLRYFNKNPVVNLKKA